MLKETLNIRKLGALDDTGVVEISPLTVFIGNSASGKSTLMKTLVLMRYIFKRLSIKAYLQNSHIKDSVISFKFKDLLRDNMNVLVSAETYIHYSVAINGTVYSVTYSNGKLSYNATIPNGDLCFFKEVWVTESRSAIAPLSGQGLALALQYEYAHNVAYLPIPSPVGTALSDSSQKEDLLYFVSEPI